ncbi:MAG: hypothetical protein WCJ81_09430 [bacterium]
MYKFADIDRLEMRTFRTATSTSNYRNGVSLGTSNFSYGYQFFLVTKAGKEIDIQGGQKMSYQQNIFTALYGKNKEIADSVATFINVPVVEVNNTANLIN